MKTTIALKHTTPATFKRLDVGLKFTSDANGTKGRIFRKVAKEKAVELDPETMRG